MIAGNLASYYEKEGRALPWRIDKDPYHVHLSEIMLQQTRVEAVIGYYGRFLSRFPSVESLANAKEEEVLKLWEGLGYYSRARNLLASAKVICERHGGIYPKKKKELLSLPGVGEYTASAISAICFHEKVVPVDGNFLRIYARLNKSKDDISFPSVKKSCAIYFGKLFPYIEPGLLAQSVMELGQRVCIPNGKPLCLSCPLREVCKANEEGSPENYPVITKKKTKKEEPHTVLVFSSNGRLGYEKRPGKGLLASLYGFPMEEGHMDEKTLLDLLQNKGIKPISITPLGEFEHVFTHKVWKMGAVLIEAKEELPNLTYLSLEKRMDSFPLPSAFLAIEKVADTQTRHK